MRHRKNPCEGEKKCDVSEDPFQNVSVRIKKQVVEDNEIDLLSDIGFIIIQLIIFSYFRYWG